MEEDNNSAEKVCEYLKGSLNVPSSVVDRFRAEKKIFKKSMTSLSYHHKPRSNPLDNRTLHQILDDNTTKHPDKEFFVFYDANQHRSSLTFKQLKDQSIKFAASLLKLGFKRGDRILLYAPNSLEFVVSWMAISRVGACAVMMCPLTAEWEEVATLKRLGCTGFICGLQGLPDEQRERMATEVMKIAQQKKHLIKVIITIGESDTKIKHPHVLQYENLIQNDIDQAEVIATGSKVDADDPAFSCFTSGSTGKAKAVVYTHHGIINGANIVLPGMKSDGDDKRFSSSPTAWSDGAPAVVRALIVGFTYITTLYNKATINDSYKVMFDITSKEKCSSCTIPQEHVHRLIAEKFQDKHDFSAVSAWGFGSQIVPRKTMKALLDVLPERKAILVYAGTEILTIGIQPLSQATIDNKEDYGKMYMFPDIEVKVIDDQGQVVPLGTKGEICVRGPKMFLEYLEDPVKTSKTKTSSGWVHTSDYGIMYDRARIKVLGRKTDMIVTSNQAVFSVEIEEILLENPDVQYAVAVGVPNKDNKEDICACVIEVPGCNLEARVDELKKWCTKAFEENGNKNSIPKPSHFLFMKNFPISDCAKIDRPVIKKFAKENCKL